MYYFQDLLADSGIRVEGFMGGVAPPGGLASTHVAIATIEKANSLVNRLMEENNLANLGAVIIDELHLLGDPNRGYLLELLLTKLKYMTLRDVNIKIQMIGMSATLPNLSLLAEWLDAELYKTDFRPVPLNEQCKIGTSIYDNQWNLIRNLPLHPELSMDLDNILQLCIETISDGHSILIFCPTKNWCEKLAEQIATAFSKLGREDTQIGEMLRQQIDLNLILETLEQLKRSPAGLDNVLKNTVSLGVAFHHAALTMDERDIIEGSFRSGSLRVLIATSTLSSGVNLPARRVIIRSPMFNGKTLDVLTYKQMIGRAGRMGKDTAGESILVCKANERNNAHTLLSASLEPIESCLEDAAPLIRALLEAVASDVVRTSADLELYTNCTLVSFSKGDEIKNPSKDAVQFLVDNEFVLLRTIEQEEKWIATALGKACLAASIPPREGLILFEELQRARKCFVLDTELHVIYLVTPINAGSQIPKIDWMVFLEQWKAISESERRVGNLVGIEERFLMSAMRGIVKPGKLLSIHKRFYTALALHDLVRETPLHVVSKKYGCCRGILQSLQQTAATFAGMVTQFCKQLGWDCIEILVSQFQTRLQFGVCRELLDLLRLPMLNGLRARSLYKHKITSISELAVANEIDVEQALYKALPFESVKEQIGEHESETVKRNKIRTVFVTGRDGLTPHEAAVMLIKEARILVQNELGLQDVLWKQHDESTVTKASAPSENNCSISKINSKTKQETFDNEPLVSVKTNVENTQCVKQNFDTDGHDGEPSDVSSNCMNTNESMMMNTSVANDTQLKEVAKEISQRNTIEDLNISPSLFKDSEIRISSLNPANDNHKTLNENLSACSSSVFKSSLSGLDDIKSFETFSLNKTMTLSTKENDKNERVSSSPSLFDESLNLDTQMYNILEENIIDTLCPSAFEETKESKSNVLMVSNSERVINNINNINKNTSKSSVIKRYGTKSSTSGVMCSLGKNVVFTWEDDSWNESKGITNKLNQLNKTNVGENKLQCKRSTDIPNISGSTDIISSIIEMKDKCNKDSKISVQSHKNVGKSLPENVHEHKLISSSELPIDSSKSVSNTVIKTSQPRDSPITNIGIRNNLNLVNTYKTPVRNSTDYGNKKKTTQTDTPTNPVSRLTDIQGHALRAKLRKVTGRSMLLSTDCSTDSIISNSDEDTPVKKVRVLQKAQENWTPTKINQMESKHDIGSPGNLDLCLYKHNTADSSNVKTDWNTLNIIKVGSDRKTFSLFKRELMNKNQVALALHCELWVNDTSGIGTRVVGSATTRVRKRSKKTEEYVYKDIKLCGAAFSWESNIAYYISFSNGADLRISAKEQMKLLQETLSNTDLYIICFGTKEVYKLLYQCCGTLANCKFLDPKTGDWLCNGTISEKSYNEMVLQYVPNGRFIAERIDISYETGPGINIKSTLPGEFRASAEAVLTWHTMDILLEKLEQLNPMLLYMFKEIEMRTIVLLAHMELTGIGICSKSLQELCSVINDEMSSLEEKAYSLFGKKFNFSSSKEVSKVLGLYKGKKISTNKAVLEQCENPIASLIISWRKLNATLSMIVYPLISLSQHESRIHGNCITSTCTGRISMQEPNLQNVPKDFSSEDNTFVISVRMAFVPTTGNVILSADYCQLELRILAHFSKDPTLRRIMQKNGDIFKSMAAMWNHVTEEEVDSNMRQCTKQLCYGMIYGMGVQALAKSLSISETEAKVFLESFMNTYPGIRKWFNKVLEDARKSGYVTTLLGRRRILPHLNSIKTSDKAQAERQAINTKVQGSAADIAKKALINIEDRMRHEFPNSLPILPVARTTRKLRSNNKEQQQRGGYLVLQLHDEFLYEVNMSDIQQVLIIVKESMEQVCQLEVPLPVKIRIGPAWGDLTEYEF
ncbi:hypothetical protein KM043_011783 [Ampulex compressa]|nr:hypothetical protein KM043_011783 [Ampulex compressa]